jgi:hypothetical protein
MYLLFYISIYILIKENKHLTSKCLFILRFYRFYMEF